MCGIVYKHNFDGTPVNNDVMQQFDAQRKRGTEGFGLFDGQGMHLFHAAKENRILNWLVRNNTNLLLFHHRYPTTTINVKRVAHPFTTKDYFGKTQYILVHNGGVTNADELKLEHENLGINYHGVLPDKSFNDSESFLWDFALYMEGKQKELKSEGPCAFICLKIKNKRLVNMYFGHNYLRPLNIMLTPEGVEISSEGAGEPVDEHVLHTYNYKQKRMYTKHMRIPTPIYKSLYDNGQYTGEANSGFHASPKPATAWNSRDELQKAGNWLGDHLRDKFSHLYPELQDTPKTTAPLVGEVVNNGQSSLLLPAGPSAAQKELSGFKDLLPSAAEVENQAIMYLGAVNGHFEQAYWALEVDYNDLEFQDESPQTMKQRILLERVLDYISNDPEYENEESVSSLWLAIC